ncbi:MAG: hypothetical protein KDB79_07510 [Acidobacteria bacterium]|nr:hypothetical protein [Acidobacteriota bacterium]
MIKTYQMLPAVTASVLLAILLTVGFPVAVVSQTPETSAETRPQDGLKNQKNKDEEQPDPDLIRAENKIVLVENGDKNSFINTVSGRAEDLVKIEEVRNGGKLLSGTFDVIFSCIDSPAFFAQALAFNSGRADLLSDCRVKTAIILLAYIVLKKGADTNGYGATNLGGGQTLINIAAAKDTVSGGLLDGEFNLVLKCKQAARLIAFAVVIAKGYAEQRAGCSLDRDPRIYY